MISPDGLLQKQYVHELKYDVTIAPHSIIPIILHEFHNWKGHQGTVCTFKAIRRFYWWPKSHMDIVNHINRCNICARNLPNMAKYLQQHLEIPHIPMALLAMDTMGHLPVTFREHQWALTATSMHPSYVFTISMNKKSAENVLQAYLSNIFDHKGGSVAILSNNCTEFKNTQWGMQPTRPQKNTIKAISPQRQLKIWKCVQLPQKRILCFWNPVS